MPCQHFPRKLATTADHKSPVRIVVLKDRPAYIHSDNGSEFTATLFKQWLQDLGVSTAYVEPGSLWENGYCESFNAKMRDELLNGELLEILQEAVVLTGHLINLYNTVRLHSALGYRQPAP